MRTVALSSAVVRTRWPPEAKALTSAGSVLASVRLTERREVQNHSGVSRAKSRAFFDGGAVWRVKPSDCRCQPADCRRSPEDCPREPADCRCKARDCRCRPSACPCRLANCRCQPPDCRCQPSDCRCQPPDCRCQPSVCRRGPRDCRGVPRDCVVSRRIVAVDLRIAKRERRAGGRPPLHAPSGRGCSAYPPKKPAIRPVGFTGRVMAPLLSSRAGLRPERI